MILRALLFVWLSLLCPAPCHNPLASFPVDKLVSQASFPRVAPGIPADAVTCCDGSGGFTVCYRAGARDKAEETGDDAGWYCLTRHERDHVAWFKRYMPGACAGRSYGAYEFTMTSRQHDDTECRAYAVQLACLREFGLEEMATSVALRRISRQLYDCP